MIKRGQKQEISRKVCFFLNFVHGVIVIVSYCNVKRWGKIGKECFSTFSKKYKYHCLIEALKKIYIYIYKFTVVGPNFNLTVFSLFFYSKGLKFGIFNHEPRRTKKYPFGTVPEMSNWSENFFNSALLKIRAEPWKNQNSPMILY